MRIDTQRVNRTTDLLALASRFTSLRRVAGTGGGEYAGACPFCGGKDRFRVQPDNHIWLCRHCTNGKWEDPISLARRLNPKDSFQSVCERLSGGKTSTTAGKKQSTPVFTPAAVPPDQEWQALALSLVERCEKALWEPIGANAREYLHQRGLKDETIKRFRLGYRDAPSGISIPCFVKNRLWYVKFRQLATQPKYILLKGSKPAAIFNADTLVNSFPCLFVEGEFDCILSDQEFGYMLPVVTLGSATNQPDLATWGIYLIRPGITYILPDNDEAGELAAATIARSSRNPILASLPNKDCKDITDYHQAGGNICQWACNLMEFHDPLPATWEELAESIGGVIAKKGNNSHFQVD